MIYGPVRTTRIAYRKKGKENLYPQDAELNWGPRAVFGGDHSPQCQGGGRGPV